MGSARPNPLATPANDAVHASLNPANMTVLGEVPCLGVEEVRAAVARARVAQRDWARLSVEDRSRRLFAFRDEILTRAEEVAELLSKEQGKPLMEALVHDLVVVVDLAIYFCKRAHKILAPHPITLHLL